MKTDNLKPAIEYARSLIGKSGEFLHSNGRTCACRVTGVDRHSPLLIISYVHPENEKTVTGAYIHVSSFHPDK